MNKNITNEINRLKTFLLDNKISWLEIEPSKYIAEFKDIIIGDYMYDVSFHCDGEVRIYKYSESEEYIKDGKAVDYSLFYNVNDDNFMLNANIRKLSLENDGSVIEDHIKLLKSDNTIYKEINGVSVFHDIQSDNTIPGLNSYIGEIQNNNLNVLNFKFEISKDNLLVDSYIHFYSRFKDYTLKREYNISSNKWDGIRFDSRYNYATRIGSRYNSSYYNNSEYIDDDLEYLYDNIDSGISCVDGFLNDFLIYLRDKIKNKNPNGIYIPYSEKEFDASKLLEFDTDFDRITDKIISDMPFGNLDINRRLNKYVNDKTNDSGKKKVRKKDC